MTIVVNNQKNSLKKGKNMSTEMAKANAAEFILAYKLRKQLEEVKLEGEKPSTFWEDFKTEYSADMNPDLKVNQIRLLSILDQQTNILITRIEGDNIWFIPFSPYPEPATSDELVYSRNLISDSLHVLQVWNARTWHRKFIEKSWVRSANEIGEKENKRADEAYFMIFDDMPDHLKDEIGIGINEFSKPDLETVLKYRQEERLKFFEIDDQDLAYWDSLPE